jgi:disulfide bond formation protein DsbB
MSKEAFRHEQFSLGYTAVNIEDTNPRLQTAWLMLFAAWVLVTTATLTSLFFSEVMSIPVCELCWYQRVAMYPLVLILAIGLFPYDPRVVRYAAALAGIGWLIALFQLLLITGVIPESAQPCVQGIPCTQTHIALFGFMNIPTLSLLTFTVLGALLFYTYRMEKI